MSTQKELLKMLHEDTARLMETQRELETVRRGVTLRSVVLVEHNGNEHTVEISNGQYKELMRATVARYLLDEIVACRADLNRHAAELQKASEE